jgi:hypothetical protein
MLRDNLLSSKKFYSDDSIVIRVGKVESVYDEYDGLRIKVRVKQDGKKDVSQLDYAFPLLPKTIQSVPKKGEAVLVFYGILGNKESNRYYIGPLISQPQYFNKEYYNPINSTPTSLLVGSINKPLPSISHFNETKGAFPKINDIALVGRKSEDIILKDGEIDIRCGIRGKKAFDENDSTASSSGLIGDVIFNSHSPSYIQLKYKRGITKGNKQTADSVINLVGDKINIISHQDVNYFNLTDQDNLINENELDDIMSKLHQLPYGDILVDVLKKIIDVFSRHVHKYPGLPPLDMFIEEINSIDLEKILSDHVRIS